jgi:HK97 gp10 family phage protein
MSANLEVSGFVDLEQDLNAMAEALSESSGKGARAMVYILQDSAMPIRIKMAQMCPVGATGNLQRSIKIGRVVKRRKGGFRVTVGVHKEEGATVAYANPVESGHGGPHPAPPHPFVKPAFDVAKDEAYAALRDRLRAALKARGAL